MENKYLSKRFSPGYGDLSLEIQKNLLAYLDAHRRIGIELTENYLMIPQKSVTAILGVHTRPFKDKYARCDACIRRENCKRQGEDTVNFIHKLNQSSIFDGSMGATHSKGIQSEGDPSLLNMSHPDVIRDIHKSYASAGADL